MDERPYTLLSCAISVDGCLDDAGPERLVLSDDADLDRVDAERAGCDAILVGANTVRRDDPRLLVRSPVRRAARRARGLPEDPVKVTLTGSGDIDPGSRFFRTGDGVKLVYAPAAAAPALRARLGAGATVAGLDHLDLPALLADLVRRGVRRLMVEGGGRLLAAFLAGGLADELQLAIAPFFVGDPDAPRFAPPGAYPYGPGRPMALAGVRRVGGLVLHDYLLRTEEPDARS